MYNTNMLYINFLFFSLFFFIFLILYYASIIKYTLFLFYFIHSGHRNRRVGSHEMNMDSSRSHSLLTLHLESESIDPDDGHMMVSIKATQEQM